MPGRTLKQAHAAFITPLKETLHCLTWQPLSLDEKPLAVGVEKGLMLGTPSAPVELDGELQDGSHPALFVGIEYTLVKDPEASAAERFRVSTRKYTYHVTNSMGQEVLLYHWHPDTEFDRPHLHVGKEQLGKNPAVAHDAHVPTGRVALELLALFLIDELGVKAQVSTYSTIIQGHLANFVANRNWHG